MSLEVKVSNLIKSRDHEVSELTLIREIPYSYSIKSLACQLYSPLCQRGLIYYSASSQDGGSPVWARPLARAPEGMGEDMGVTRLSCATLS